MKFLLFSIVTISLSYGSLAQKDQSNSLPWLEPSKVSPINFLNTVKKKDDKILFLTVAPFPEKWISVKEVDSLITRIRSKEKAYCVVNLLSSFLPTEDSAQIGGYVIKIISSYRDKKKLDFGLWACPKVDSIMANELIKWWSGEKMRKE